MESITREALSKQIKECLRKAFPGLHFFTYPMERYKMEGGTETGGFMIHTTFLGQDVTAHIRFPVTTTGEFLVGSVSLTVNTTVACFSKTLLAAIESPDSLGGDRHQDLTFGEALIALRYGAKVARTGWNGKDMFLIQVPGSCIHVEESRPLAACFPVGTEVECLPHINLKTTDGKIVPWTCSQTDMQALDWRLV